MGIFESIVVVYLRKIYYPNGFEFPLAVISEQIINIELFREVCTLIMLLSVAWLTANNKNQIFPFFLFSFAVWDIVYYIGLKIILNWPSSFFTWDILFLIPVPWVGPVISPIIVSLTMICLSLIILYTQKNNSNFKLRIYEWLLIYLGAVLIFISFIWDYAKFIIENLSNKISISAEINNSLALIYSRYVPTYFHWDIYIVGIISIYISIFLIIKRFIFSTKLV